MVLFSLTAVLTAFLILPTGTNNPWQTTYLVFVCGGLVLLLIKWTTDLTDWMNRLILVLILVNVASYAYASNDYYGRQALVFNVAGLGVMVGARELFANRIKWLILGIIMAGVVGSIINISMTHSAGFGGNSNYTGHWLAVPATLSFWLLLNRKWWAAIPWV